MLHPTAHVFVWHRPACPDHVPRYLAPGGRDRAAPADDGSPRAVPEGDGPLPGRPRRRCRLDSSPGTWLADRCTQAGRPCVLGPARSLPASHGGQATHETIDAHTIAGRLRGGRRPQASV
jgi:hypothetical protein